MHEQQAEYLQGTQQWPSTLGTCLTATPTVQLQP